VNNIGPVLHGDRPKVVAFGGGKGGVGRSTLCVDIARAMTRSQQRVLCVDTGSACPTLNVLLSTEEIAFDPRTHGLEEDDSHIADFISETIHSGIWLASLAAARRHPFRKPRLSADQILLQVHELDFDWVFFDLSPGFDPFDLTLFVLADLPILVTTPEPASIRMTTQFLRASLYQAVGYHPDARAVRDELLELLSKQPLQMNARSLRFDAPGAQSRRIIDDTTQALETYLIVNQVREGAEHDLGFVLAHAWHRELHLFPRLLASIDYAERRWFYSRRTTGLGTNRGEDLLSNDIEALGRAIRDIDLLDARYPRPVPLHGDVHPALRLGISLETGRNEVRQHCRRLWEGYRRETAVGLVFEDPQQRLATAEELEASYRKVLTMPSENFTRAEVEEAMRINERNRGGGSAPSSTTSASDISQEIGFESSGRSTSTPAEPAQPQASTRQERSPGQLIASLRRQHNMSLQELSSRTHIGTKYLAAIEDVDLKVLPRPVYLRGYLREIARVFDVHPQELVDQYFRFLEQS
jgi:flagellar biosynthesis protein FlhG